MTHRRPLAACAIGGAAALMLAAAPAWALSTVNVIGGGTPANTALTFAAAVPTTSSLQIVDTRSNAALSCVSQSAANTIVLNGRAKTGTGQSPTNLAQVTNSTWPAPGCNFAGTAAGFAHGVATSATATPSQNLTWVVNVAATSSPAVAGNPRSGQTTPVIVTGVGLTVRQDPALTP